MGENINMATSGSLCPHISSLKMAINCVHRSSRLLTIVKTPSHNSFHTTATESLPFGWIEEQARAHREDYQATREEKEFRKLLIPGFNFFPEPRSPRFRKQWEMERIVVDRAKSMPIDNDWTATWPTAGTFRWSKIPIPVRQGRA